ncbi:MAG: hypothetical protein EOP04_08640 [Proteobacteria bacterium]|nr:MAG: hypothetical protein EOP04_08640 [Pseudomonadota bacterium]
MTKIIDTTKDYLRASVRDIELFFAKNGKVLVWLAALLLVPYGFELFNLNLTIDDESWATGPGAYVWLLEGRWMQFLLTKLLFPFVVVPVVPFVVAIASTTIATVSILRNFRVVENWQLIVLSFLVVSFPSLTHTLGFDSLKFGIGIGYLILALALSLFKRKGRSLLTSGVLIGLAISIYQSMAMAAVTILLIYLMVEAVNRKSDNKAVFRQISLVFVVMAIAIMVHIVGKKLLGIILGTPTNMYLQQFIKFQGFLNDPATFALDALRNASKGYGFLGSLHMGYLWGFRILITLSSLVVLLKILRQPARWLLLAMGIAAFLLVPFGLTLLYGGLGLPWRTHIELPYAWTGLVMMGVLFSRDYSSRFIYYSLWSLAIWSGLSFSTTVARMSGSAHLTLQSDRLFASQLLLKINKLRNDHPEIKYLAMLGQHVHDSSTELKPKSWEGNGLSFFEIDGGIPLRGIYFMRTIERMDLEPAPLDTLVRISNLQGPTLYWPSEGSVFIFENTIVARLGPYTQERLSELCPNGSKLPACPK